LEMKVVPELLPSRRIFVPDGSTRSL